MVILPSGARDMTIYERLASVLNTSATISLTGDTYYWPTSPTHSLDVVAFDSTLVLPTPGEVRMLS